MKKILFLASLAAVAMTSCTSESNEYVGGNDNTPKEIAFKPMASSMTRAVVSGARTATSGFAAGQTMYVAAYNATANADYFDGTLFSKSAEKWSGGKYWPMGVVSLNFLAVTEGPESAAPVFGTASANFASQAVVTMTDNSTTQHDLMYSCVRTTTTDNGNGTFTYPDVALEFKHALSWVCFTVKAYDAATAGAGIVLKNITLNDAVYSGICTISLANYSSASEALSATPAWSTSDYTTKLTSAVDKTVLDSDGSIAVNSTSPQNVENATDKKGILLVPNPNKTEEVLNPSFASFTVKFTDSNSTERTFTYTPTTRSMEPGKKYIYNIIFKLNEILIVPTVQDWTDGGSSDVQIP